MTINCAIIDDEPLAAGLLESYAKKTPYLNHVGTYNSAITAMKDLRDNPAQLLFLDIQMPELSGIEFAKILPKDTKITTKTRRLFHESILALRTRLQSESLFLRMQDIAVLQLVLLKRKLKSKNLTAQDFSSLFRLSIIRAWMKRLAIGLTAQAQFKRQAVSFCCRYTM